MEDNDSPKDIFNEKTGQYESWSEMMARKGATKRAEVQARLAAETEEAWKIVGGKPKTQKQQREERRKELESEARRAKLTQGDILAKCNTDGHCKVTINDIKNAFPKLVSQIAGNDYRTQIDNKQFLTFLLSNGLTFSLPDFVFRKQA